MDTKKTTPMMTTLILRTATRLLLPLSLVFAMFIYFKGHQTPGGGFVAGLVTAVAIVMLRMAVGGPIMDRMMALKPPMMIVVGLSLALGTGATALILPGLLGQANLPFFTSNHGYMPLPESGGGGEFEWATVMLFDLGVFLTVAGVVIGMIDALSRELE